MNLRVLFLSTVVLSGTGCSKLIEILSKDEPAATTAAAPAATTPPTVDSAPAATASASAPAAKAAAPNRVAEAKKVMAVPSPTTDRIQRNRDKDPPCPPSFVEQPGVENHSICARVCKTEKDCHGHLCEDSDVGNGKVCLDVPSKAPAAKPVAAKCKAGEFDDDGTCLKTCNTDSDCPKKGTCEQIRVPNPNGGTSAAAVCR